MPNWCSNHLDIDGPIPVVDHFLVVFAKRGFAGHKPEPKDPDSDPEYDWDEWRNRNWGTKWNVTDEDWSVVSKEVNGDRKMVRLSLTTAWSPPTEWLRAVAGCYLDRPMHFRLAFLEEGMCFSGVVEFWCETKIERSIDGSLWHDESFHVAAYRDALIEFGSDARISYSFVAHISGARLKISERLLQRYPSLVQMKDALELGDRDRAVALIRPLFHCMFDGKRVCSMVDLLSDSFDGDTEGNEHVETEVEDVRMEDDFLIVSAQAQFSAEFAVPFVSLRDFL
jgi:hypothetical protein